MQTKSTSVNKPIEVMLALERGNEKATKVGQIVNL